MYTFIRVPRKICYLYSSHAHVITFHDPLVTYYMILLSYSYYSWLCPWCVSHCTAKADDEAPESSGSQAAMAGVWVHVPGPMCMGRCPHTHHIRDYVAVVVLTCVRVLQVLMALSVEFTHAEVNS